jgi:hypothetical protein
LAGQRLIFLDIDGVLNGHDAHRHPNGYCGIDPACVYRLNRIVAETGADLVISSAWRYLLHSSMVLAGFHHMMRTYGLDRSVRIRGITCADEFIPDRGPQIRYYLDTRPAVDHAAVESYVILDDGSDEAPHPPATKPLTESLVEHHERGVIVFTDGAVGLTDADADRAIAILRASCVAEWPPIDPPRPAGRRRGETSWILEPLQERAEMATIEQVIESLMRSSARVVRLRRLGDRALSRLLMEVVWSRLDMDGLPSDAVAEACDRLARRGFKAGEPDPVSPVECDHRRSLFVQSSSGAGPGLSAREHVSVCPDCGRFAVSATRNGESIRVAFELPTDELVRAAGQYARHLRGETGDTCQDGEHKWVSRRMGGAPDAVESYEVVEYCDICGMERVDID